MLSKLIDWLIENRRVFRVKCSRDVATVSIEDPDEAVYAFLNTEGLDWNPALFSNWVVVGRVPIE